MFHCKLPEFFLINLFKIIKSKNDLYLDIKYLWKRTSKVSLNLPDDFPKVKEHVMYKAPSNYKKYFAFYIFLKNFSDRLIK